MRTQNHTHTQDLVSATVHPLRLSVAGPAPPVPAPSRPPDPRERRESRGQTRPFGPPATEYSEKHIHHLRKREAFFQDLFGWDPTSSANEEAVCREEVGHAKNKTKQMRGSRGGGCV